MSFGPIQPQWVKKVDKVGQSGGRQRVPGSWKRDQYLSPSNITGPDTGQDGGNLCRLRRPLREFQRSTRDHHSVSLDLCGMRVKGLREAHRAPHTFGDTAKIIQAPEGK